MMLLIKFIISTKKVITIELIIVIWIFAAFCLNTILKFGFWGVTTVLSPLLSGMESSFTG